MCKYLVAHAGLRDDLASKLAKIFIDNLRHFLGDKTPYWLAKNASLAQSTVGRLLAGEVEPSFTSIEAIARALGIHPIQLLTERNSPILVEKKVSLESDQIDAIKAIIREMREHDAQEHPERVAAVAHVPDDILEALCSWNGDWNFIRAALRLDEVKTSQKKGSDAG